MIGDQRAPDAPPCDSLAEAIVLRRCLLWPELIDRVDLGPLLVFPEHRTIWQCLARARMRCPGSNNERFVRVWLEELQRADKRNALSLAQLLLDPDLDTHETMRAYVERNQRVAADPDRGHPVYRCFHGFAWWLQRLQAIAEARRGIQAAQRIAEGFWRAPDVPFAASDALNILESVVPQRAREAVRVEI